MTNELSFREVDAGFYMGFIEHTENPTVNEYVIFGGDEVISQDGTCEERWCICDPNESYSEIVSGKFDTYITLMNESDNTKFLGSFNSLKQAETNLNKLYSQGFKFETLKPAESIHYNSDYSEKKQSIFM